MSEINFEDPFSMTANQLIAATERMGAATMKLKVEANGKPFVAIFVIRGAVPEILAAIEKAEKDAGVGE